MDNSSKNQLRASLKRLNKPVVQRPYNPLYDGRASDGSADKINPLYVVLVMLVLVFLYLKTQETDVSKEKDRFRQATETYEPTNDKLLFDEDGFEIGEIGTKRDPFAEVDSTYKPRDYEANKMKNAANDKDNYAYQNARNLRKYKEKTPKRTILTDIEGLKNSLVFAGSFVNQENAERVVNRLKSMGYEKAEIVMKENLPYKVVVTGLDKPQNSAKAEVKALEKRGIDVYSTSNDLNEIYRKKNN